jgi:plasmid stabilization system protein ParE
MELDFHPDVASDIAQILDYYESVAGTQLANEFDTELKAYFQKVVQHPEAYAIRTRDLRRVNLERFPFHFLYRIGNDRIRILVVRHHSRRPSLGLNRR